MYVSEIRRFFFGRFFLSKIMINIFGVGIVKFIWVYSWVIVYVILFFIYFC